MKRRNENAQKTDNFFVTVGDASEQNTQNEVQ
jgi:hypothetical protein